MADHGPGIAPEDRERALKRFVRLEKSRSAARHGSGPQPCAAVARLHGGSVRLEDNAPGLRVVLTLPKRGRGPLRRRPPRQRRGEAATNGRHETSGRLYGPFIERISEAPRQRATDARIVSRADRRAASERAQRRRGAGRRWPLPWQIRASPSCLPASSAARPISPASSSAIPPRLARILTTAPEARLAALMAELAAHAQGRGHARRDAMRALRLFKTDVALLTALCDLGGVWPVMTVTRRAVRRRRRRRCTAPCDFLFRAGGRARATGWRGRRQRRASGYIVLAMGKYGACELNYSCDIDLIVFYDRDRIRAARRASRRSASSCA